MHTKEDKLKAFERLLDVQERLRHDCPWDKAQTFESLRPNTIEETFELCDALMKNNRPEVCKELGDVMEHVILYSVIGSETGDFDIADVCNHQADKLMFRHDFIDWRGWTVSNEDMEIDADGHVNYKKRVLRQTLLRVIRLRLLPRWSRLGSNASKWNAMATRRC